MKNNDKEHLPLYGVGPIIVYGQFIITAIAVILLYVMNWDFAKIDFLDIPFKLVGIGLIIFGFYLDICAKYKSKSFDKVAENKLITDGVYAIVRNPVKRLIVVSLGFLRNVEIHSCVYSANLVIQIENQQSAFSICMPICLWFRPHSEA